MKRSAIIVAVAATLGACSAHGARTEDGTINMGSSVFGDDRIGHRTYGSYAELAYATGELKDLEKDGLGKDQQICWANALMDNIPNSLSTRLNAYARNEISLMESEHAAMMDELEPFLKSETVAKSTFADFKAKCGA